MIQRILNSLKYAFQGLGSAWREHLNFRLELFATAALVAIELWFHFSLIEIFFLVIASLFVLLAEIVNTIMEDLLDEIVPHHHPLVGKAKDMMAGAVLIACFVVVIIFGIAALYEFRILA